MKQTTKAMLSKGNLAFVYNRQSCHTDICCQSQSADDQGCVDFSMFFIPVLLSCSSGCSVSSTLFRYICTLDKICTLCISYLSLHGCKGFYTGGFRTDNLLHLSNNLIFSSHCKDMSRYYKDSCKNPTLIHDLANLQITEYIQSPIYTYKCGI